MPPVGPGLEGPLPASGEAPAHNQVSHALRRAEIDRDEARADRAALGELVDQLRKERDGYKSTAEKLHGEAMELRLRIATLEAERQADPVAAVRALAEQRAWDTFAAAGASTFDANEFAGPESIAAVAKWAADYADALMAERAKRRGK